MTTNNATGNTSIGQPFFIFQPSGTKDVNTNTYTSFAEGTAYLFSLFPHGEVTVYFDNTFDTSFLIPTGTYNFPPTVTFKGMGNEVNVTLDMDAVFAFPNNAYNITFDSLILVFGQGSTVPCITLDLYPVTTIITAINCFIETDTVASLAVSFIKIINSADPKIVLSQSTTLQGSGGYVITFDSASSGLTVLLLDVSTLGSTSVDISTYVHSNIVVISDASAYFDPSYDAISIPPPGIRTSDGASHWMVLAKSISSSNYYLLFPGDNAAGCLTNDGSGNCTWVVNFTNPFSSTFFGPTSGNATATQFNTGWGNTALANVVSDKNTAFGYQALTTLIGVGGLNDGNTALGYVAGASQVNLINCTFLGSSTDASGNFTNATALGHGAQIGASNQIVMGNASVTSIIPMSSSSCDLGTSSALYGKLYTSGVVGLITNVAATAGMVGEAIISNLPFASATSLSSTVSKNITSINLTEGDWNVSANCYINCSGNNLGVVSVGVNTVSATLPDKSQQIGFTDSVAVFSTWGGATFNLPILVGPGGNTLYLVANVSISAGTATGCGYIVARRVR